MYLIGEHCMNPNIDHNDKTSICVLCNMCGHRPTSEDGHLVIGDHICYNCSHFDEPMSECRIKTYWTGSITAEMRAHNDRFTRKNDTCGKWESEAVEVEA